MFYNYLIDKGLFRMDTFLKVNNSGYPDSLICEADGLVLLKENLSTANGSFIKIPKVYVVSNQQLVLEKIHSRSATDKQWFQFGCALAELHKIKQAQYGFADNNYIGLNPQQNIFTDNWGEFFFKYRLMYQIELIENAKLKSQFRQTLSHKEKALIKFLNQNCKQPSLVHGDLWSGNVMFDDEHAWLIDPAVYYADREVDIAMTEMFGGFSPEFYRGYDSINPRSEDYSRKKNIYNLYHYLNHYNLFGAGYLSAVKKLINSIP